MKRSEPFASRLPGHVRPKLTLDTESGCQNPNEKRHALNPSEIRPVSGIPTRARKPLPMYFFSNSPVLQRDSESDPARDIDRHEISQVTLDESRLSCASIAHKDEPGRDREETVRNALHPRIRRPSHWTPAAWRGAAFHPSTHLKVGIESAVAAIVFDVRTRAWRSKTA